MQAHILSAISAREKLEQQGAEISLAGEAALNLFQLLLHDKRYRFGLNHDGDPSRLHVHPESLHDVVAVANQLYSGATGFSGALKVCENWFLPGLAAVTIRPELNTEYKTVVLEGLRILEGWTRACIIEEHGLELEHWDIFISHASEDKEPFVRQLATQLRNKGVRVWYDEFSLEVGDNIRRSIENGLVKARYGVVILSHQFFAKEWPQRELDALFNRERSGKKVILPVWLDVDAEDVARYSPLLATIRVTKANEGMDTVVKELLRVLRPAT